LIKERDEKWDNRRTGANQQIQTKTEGKYDPKKASHGWLVIVIIHQTEMQNYVVVGEEEAF
jgi:hypothetical protein